MIAVKKDQQEKDFSLDSDLQVSFSEHILNTNHNRLKLLFPVLFFIFFTITTIFWLILPESPYTFNPGGKILLTGHIIALLVTGFSTFISHFSIIRKDDKLTNFYSYYLPSAAFLSIFSLTIIGIGDLCIYESSLSFVGSILGLSIIFIIGHRFSIVMFFVPLVLILTSVWISDFNIDLKINQTVNLSAFTVIAWTLSRYLYNSNKKLFHSNYEKNKLTLQVQAIEIDNAKREVLFKLATTIAHEFNNPLQIIQNASDLMLIFGKEVDSSKKACEIIPEQITRMQELINKLLQLSEIEEIDYAEGIKIMNLHSDENMPDKDINMNKH